MPNKLRMLIQGIAMFMTGAAIGFALWPLTSPIFETTHKPLYGIAAGPKQPSNAPTQATDDRLSAGNIGAEKLTLLKDIATPRRYVVARTEGSVKLEDVQAKIDAKLIKNMRVGQSGYIVSWAFDPATGALDTDYTFTEEPFRTSVVKITRTQDGFVVDLDSWADYELGRYR